MVLEKLGTPKFEPLSISQQRLVFGGEPTAKGSEFSHIEWDDTWVDDGRGGKRHRWREVRNTWSSDEIGGNRSCYYDQHLSAGSWN